MTVIFSLTYALAYYLAFMHAFGPESKQGDIPHMWRTLTGKCRKEEAKDRGSTKWMMNSKLDIWRKLKSQSSCSLNKIWSSNQPRCFSGDQSHSHSNVPLQLPKSSFVHPSNLVLWELPIRKYAWMSVRWEQDKDRVDADKKWEQGYS